MYVCTTRTDDEYEPEVTLNHEMILRMSCLVFAGIIRCPPKIENKRKANLLSSALHKYLSDYSSPLRSLIEQKPSNHGFEFSMPKFLWFFNL